MAVHPCSDKGHGRALLASIMASAVRLCRAVVHGVPTARSRGNPSIAAERAVSKRGQAPGWDSVGACHTTEVSVLVLARLCLWLDSAAGAALSSAHPRPFLAPLVSSVGRYRFAFAVPDV